MQILFTNPQLPSLKNSKGKMANQMHWKVEINSLEQSSRPRFSSYSKRDVGWSNIPRPLPGRRSNKYDHIPSSFAAEKNKKRHNLESEAVKFPLYMESIDEDSSLIKRTSYFKTLSKVELETMADEIEKRMQNDRKDLKLIKTIMNKNQKSNSELEARIKVLEKGALKKDTRITELENKQTAGVRIVQTSNPSDRQAKTDETKLKTGGKTKTKTDKTKTKTDEKTKTKTDKTKTGGKTKTKTDKTKTKTGGKIKTKTGGKIKTKTGGKIKTKTGGKIKTKTGGKIKTKTGGKIKTKRNKK